MGLGYSLPQDGPMQIRELIRLKAFYENLRWFRHDIYLCRLYDECATELHCVPQFPLYHQGIGRALRFHLYVVDIALHSHKHLSGLRHVSGIICLQISSVNSFSSSNFPSGGRWKSDALILTIKKFEIIIGKQCF